MASSSVRRSKPEEVLPDAHDDSTVLASLLAAALDHTEREGNDVLELIGFRPNERAVAENFAPLHYPQKYVNFYYKPTTTTLESSLRNPAVWDVCPFDQD